MFKFTRMTWVFFIVAILPYSTPCLALVMTSEKGMWPANWPKELEPYREKAKTIMLAAGNQEDVHEISFENRDEFEKLWPTILKLKSKWAPLRLRSIEPFKSGRLFNNEKPVVRIYGPAYSSGGASWPRGKLLHPVPPWPESVKLPGGTLPEYVTMSEDGTTWVRVEEGSFKGFMYRARIEIELVVDGNIIDLNRICLPADTPIIDKCKPADRQHRFARYAWGKELNGLRIGTSWVNRVEKNDYDKPQFHVALQNVGKKDLVLNLGIMLANGKKQYTTAVKLIFTDHNGCTYEFHNNIPYVAGRVDPFVVPLAVGCTYVLSADFDNYWSISSKGVPLSLPKGQYRVAAIFEGRDVSFKGTGVYLESLYWTGVIESGKVLFKNSCDGKPLKLTKPGYPLQGNQPCWATPPEVISPAAFL